MAPAQPQRDWRAFLRLAGTLRAGAVNGEEAIKSQPKGKLVFLGP